MKALVVTAALAATAVLFGCATSASTSADSPDDVKETKSNGCPDVDPFCDEGSGGGDEADDVGSGEDEGSSDDTATSSSSSGKIFQTDSSTAKTPEFDVVLRVAKPKPELDKDGKPKPNQKKVDAKLLLNPRGLSFGMSSEQIARLYDKLFDKAYLELFKTAPIGPQTKALEFELKEKKAQLRRSRIEFGSVPTGLDNGPLQGEYSYGNDESMSKLDLGNGIVRYFFYFGDRLWKVYDEVKLGGDSKLGSSFQSALSFAEGLIGKKPKMIEANYAAGINYPMAEWRDGTTILRVVNRESQGVCPLVFIDESIEKKLPELRKHKMSDPTAVDPSVRKVMQPGSGKK